MSINNIENHRNRRMRNYFALCFGGLMTAAWGLVLLGTFAGGTLFAQDPAAPAEEQPAENAGDAFLENYDPSKSFSRLLYPNTADSIGLSDAQKEEVSRLMSDRSAKLAATPDKNQWPEIVRQNEEALKAVLTASQLQQFELALNEKAITIRFSKTRWADVLKWLAAELGLQLVMDAPPPGTFNYNDKNKHTPKETLDILNGCLQFKGYVLIRVGEVLYLHNFKNGPIPLQFLPKVTPEQLPTQSRFDYVALTLPLVMRNVDIVMKLIKPLQGPYNSTQALPGNSLLIVDSVSALRQIVPVALSVTNPPVPPRVIPSPIWKTYSLSKVTPSFVRDEVAKVVPTAHPLLNPTTKQISFLAIPGMQTTIAGMIEILEEGGDPNKEAICEVYSLNDITSITQDNLNVIARRLGVPTEVYFMTNSQLALGSEIVSSLRLLCPDATITFNELTKQIFVVARPDDQARIRDAIEKLKAPVSDEERQALRVYTLKESGNSISQDDLNAFRNLVPSAMISFDQAKGILRVVGTPKEQSQVADAVANMNLHYTENNEDQVYAVYPMTLPQRTQFQKIFDQIKDSSEMKGAAIIEDEKMKNRVGFWGTARQQETIRRIVAQVTGTASSTDGTQDASTAILEPVVSGETVESAESQAAPANAEGNAEANKQAENADSASGSENSHEASGTENAEPASGENISPETTQETQKTEGENADISAPSDIPLPGAQAGTYLAVFSVEKTDPKRMSELLANSIPGLEVEIEETAKKIIVYGTRAMLASAQKMRDELEKADDTALETIPFAQSFPLATLTALQRLEPTATVTYDLYRKEIYLAGKADCVARLKKHIESIQADTPQEDETLYYLDVTKKFPEDVLNGIRKIVPKTQVNYDAASRRFTLFGTPTDQLLAVKLINDAELNLPADEETRFYSLDRRVSDEMILLVQEAVPEASEVKKDGENPKALAVKARPEIQEKMDAVLARIQENYPDAGENILVFYSLDEERAKTFNDLKADFEKENGAIKIVGHENGRLAVWALPAQQEALKKLVDQIADESENEASRKTARLYSPKYVDAKTLSDVLNGVCSGVTISLDADGKRMILKGMTAKVNDALDLAAQVDVKETDGVKRSFAAFDIKGMAATDRNGAPYSPTQLLQDLERLVPAAKITYENYNQRVIVWGTEEEHAIIEEAIGNLNEETNYKDRFLRHEIRRGDPNILISLVKSAFARAEATYDSKTNAIVVNVHPSAQEDLRAFLEIIDPENPSPLDPTLKIYTFDKTPTQETADSLQKLAPNAKITINKDSRQMMVIARPSELKTIDENIGAIEGMVSPSDPFVKFYGFDHEPTAAVIRSLTSSLKKIAPEAVFEIDKNNRQLMVIATPKDQEKIEASVKSIVETFNPIDLKMVPYPVYGMDVDALKKSLVKIYPEMKIEIDPVGKRLLIWATLDQHVKVSEEIASINKAQEETEGEDYNGPQMKVYAVQSAGQAEMIRRTIQTMFPTAEVYSEFANDQQDFYSEEDYWSDRLRLEQKVTVLAPAREQRLIAALFDEQTNPSNRSEKRMETWNFGDMEADAIESTLQNLLFNAVSLSPSEVKKLSDDESRFHYPTENSPFFRVDPKRKTASVYAEESDLAKVRAVLGKMIATAGEEPAMQSKVHTLTSPIAATLLTTLRKIVPSAQFTGPDAYHIIAYATEKDHQTIDRFMTGLNDLETSETHYKMKSVTLPEGGMLSRDEVVHYLSTQFARQKGYAYKTGNPTQIILWATPRVMTEMESFFQETCQGETKEYYQAYPVDHLTPAAVIPLLAKICPNAVVTPDVANKKITVLATPFDQRRIRSALAEIDAKRTGDAALAVQYYHLDGNDPKMFYPTLTALSRQFPTAAIIPDYANLQFTIVGTEKDLGLITGFFKTIKKHRLETSPELQVYRLNYVNFLTIQQVLATSVPTAAVFAGKTPDEFYAFAKPEVQETIREMVGQIDSIREDGPQGMSPRIYSLDAKAARQAVAQLKAAIPGAQLYPISQNRVLMWGSEADHQAAAKFFGTLSEAYPKTEVARYSFQYLKYADAATFVTQRYYPDAILYPSTAGDMIVQASAKIQREIAEYLKKIDVPQAKENTPEAMAYDISEIPAASYPTAMQNIAKVCPDAVFLPTVTPGYFVIYAKPADQEKIDGLIRSMLIEQPQLKGRLERYVLKNVLYAQALPLIREVAPTAKVSPGRETNQIYVWAKNSDQARIANAVEKMNEEASDETITRVYRLQKANLTKTQTTILTLYPGFVKSVMDAASQTITVAASEFYQRKIADLIQELDRVDSETQPSIRVFNISGVTSAAILTHIKAFYAKDPDFKINYDPAYESLVVQGTPEQIETVGSLVKQVQKGGLSDPTLEFKTYTIRNSWAYYTLKSVFTRQGRKVDMQIDYSTGKLLVLARADEHRAIAGILDALAPEPTKLAVFELQEVDPETAATILSTMLESDGTFVDVQFDYNSNKLYIRATEKKLEEIRRFLVEAGEKSLENEPLKTTDASETPTDFHEPEAMTGEPSEIDELASAALEAADQESASQESNGQESGGQVKIQGSGPLRTIYFDGDLQGSLEDVQKNWTRSNPLEVIRQGEPLIQKKEDVSEDEGQSPESETQDSSPNENASPSESVSPEESSQEPKGEGAKEAAFFKGAKAFAFLSASALLTSETSASEGAKEETKDEKTVEAAPGVYAVMNEDGSLTITSADTEALEAFQAALLKSFRASSGKDAPQTADAARSEETAEGKNAADNNAANGNDDEDDDEVLDADGIPKWKKDVRYMVRHKREAAAKKLVLEDRDYSVYKIEEVSVFQMVQRLNAYMADKINPKSTFNPSPYALKKSGVSMKTISSGPRLTFTPDNFLNTITVTGSKTDRDEAGMMIAILDKAELFPQPITKPYKIPVRNTSVTKMAQQVLNVFQLKFMATQLPGGLTPRISPNTESNVLEVYAPEKLAKEIEEYVVETDAEILEDKSNQVQIVPLEEVNAIVLQKYINNLTGNRNNYILVSPYMLNPSYTRQPAPPRQF